MAIAREPALDCSPAAIDDPDPSKGSDQLTRAIRRAFLVTVPLVLAGCASSSASGSAPAIETSTGRVELTRVGSAVQITENAESTHECEYVTQLPLTSHSVSDANALRALRNEAGRSGANLVLLVMDTRTTIERAEGYLCAD